MTENPSLHSLDELKMGQMTEQLIDVLDQLAIVLESDGATDWSQWMRKAKAHLMNSDYYGVEYLLSAFGGMGSLNDLILGQHHVDGVWAWKPGHVELNTRFDALRSEAAALASAIKRTQQN